MANLSPTALYDRLTRLEKELQRVKIAAYFTLPQNVKERSSYPQQAILKALKETRSTIWERRYAKLKNMAKHTTQRIFSYFAVFDPAKEGGYNVSFPEFPGCVTFGRSFEEAKEKSKEVLELWLEELALQKEKIPVRTRRPIIDEVRVAFPR